MSSLFIGSPFPPFILLPFHIGIRLDRMPSYIKEKVITLLLCLEFSFSWLDGYSVVVKPQLYLLLTQAVVTLLLGGRIPD